MEISSLLFAQILRVARNSWFKFFATGPNLNPVSKSDAMEKTKAFRKDAKGRSVELPRLLSGPLRDAF